MTYKRTFQQWRHQTTRSWCGHKSDSWSLSKSTQWREWDGHKKVSVYRLQRKTSRDKEDQCALVDALMWDLISVCLSFSWCQLECPLELVSSSNRGGRDPVAPKWLYWDPIFLLCPMPPSNRPQHCQTLITGRCLSWSLRSPNCVDSELAVFSFRNRMLTWYSSCCLFFWCLPWSLGPAASPQEYHISC